MVSVDNVRPYIYDEAFMVIKASLLRAERFNSKSPLKRVVFISKHIWK